MPLVVVVLLLGLLRLQDDADDKPVVEQVQGWEQEGGEEHVQGREQRPVRGGHAPKRVAIPSSVARTRRRAEKVIIV